MSHPMSQMISSRVSTVPSNLAVKRRAQPYAAAMIEIGSRAKQLPPPVGIVFDSLVDPHAPGARPWLDLYRDETEPRVLETVPPTRVVWSTLWPNRPDDQIHFELTPQGGSTLLRFTLLTPSDPPDEKTAGHLRYRMNTLLYADLRYSYGQ